MDGDEPRNGVHEMYDRIASHFASAREYPRPGVESFVADTTESGPVARTLDLGCSNGRHVDLPSEHANEVVGLDVSRDLLDETVARAAERSFDAGFVQGDASRFPFADDTFDLAVCVATVRHLAPRAACIISLNELARVFDTDGRVVVSAWSTAHDTFGRKNGFDTTVDWALPGGETVPRFYHIYVPDEFDGDLDTSDLTMIESTVSSGNCYAVVVGC